MTFILRWPAILALLALSLLSIVGALAAAGLITGYEAPLAQVQQAQVAAAQTPAAQAGWIDVALLAGAGLLFLVAAIRLMRRTQAFWAWLFGFACYGGRWAVAQEGDIGALVRGVDPRTYLEPQALLADPGSTAAQVGLLVVIFVVGLFILVVDAADRAYWDRQGA